MDVCNTSTSHRCLHPHVSNESMCVVLRLKCQSDLVVTSGVMERKNDKHTKTLSWLANTNVYSLLNDLVIVKKKKRVYEKPWYYLSRFLLKFSHLVTRWFCLHSFVAAMRPLCGAHFNMEALIFIRLHIVVASVQLPSLLRLVSYPTVAFLFPIPRPLPKLLFV